MEEPLFEEYRQAYYLGSLYPQSINSYEYTRKTRETISEAIKNEDSDEEYLARRAHARKYEDWFKTNFAVRRVNPRIVGENVLLKFVDRLKDIWMTSHFDLTHEQLVSMVRGSRIDTFEHLTPGGTFIKRTETNNAAAASYVIQNKDNFELRAREVEADPLAIEDALRDALREKDEVMKRHEEALTLATKQEERLTPAERNTLEDRARELARDIEAMQKAAEDGRTRELADLAEENAASHLSFVVRGTDFSQLGVRDALRNIAEIAGEKDVREALRFHIEDQLRPLFEGFAAGKSGFWKDLYGQGLGERITAMVQGTVIPDQVRRAIEEIPGRENFEELAQDLGEDLRVDQKDIDEAIRRFRLHDREGDRRTVTGLLVISEPRRGGGRELDKISRFFEKLAIEAGIPVVDIGRAQGQKILEGFLTRYRTERDLPEFISPEIPEQLNLFDDQVIRGVRASEELDALENEMKAKGTLEGRPGSEWTRRELSQLAMLLAADNQVSHPFFSRIMTMHGRLQDANIQYVQENRKRLDDSQKEQDKLVKELSTNLGKTLTERAERLRIDLAQAETRVDQLLEQKEREAKRRDELAKERQEVETRETYTKERSEETRRRRHAMENIKRRIDTRNKRIAEEDAEADLLDPEQQKQTSFLRDFIGRHPHMASFLNDMFLGTIKEIKGEGLVPDISLSTKEDMRRFVHFLQMVDRGEIGARDKNSLLPEMQWYHNYLFPEQIAKELMPFDMNLRDSSVKIKIKNSALDKSQFFDRQVKSPVTTMGSVVQYQRWSITSSDISKNTLHEEWRRVRKLVQQSIVDTHGHIQGKEAARLMWAVAHHERLVAWQESNIRRVPDEYSEGTIEAVQNHMKEILKTDYQKKLTALRREWEAKEYHKTAYSYRNPETGKVRAVTGDELVRDMKLEEEKLMQKWYQPDKGSEFLQWRNPENKWLNLYATIRKIREETSRTRKLPDLGVRTIAIIRREHLLEHSPIRNRDGTEGYLRDIRDTTSKLIHRQTLLSDPEAGAKYTIGIREIEPGEFFSCLRVQSCRHALSSCQAESGH